MQLNKIRINNSTKWDVAKYDEYVAKGGQDYYTKKRKTKPKELEEDKIINEEVRISDFAFSMF